MRHLITLLLLLLANLTYSAEALPNTIPEAVSCRAALHRVGTMVPGLYEGIKSAKLPHGWRMTNKIEQEESKESGEAPSLLAKTNIFYKTENGKEKSGIFYTRVLKDGTVSFEASYLEDPSTAFSNKLHSNTVGQIPSSIPPIANLPSLVEGRGIPTAAYVVLHQLHLLGIKAGEMKKVFLSNVIDEQTVNELKELSAEWIKENPEKPLTRAVVSKLFEKTHTYQWLKTPLTQSGHEIMQATFLGNRSKIDLLRINGPSWVFQYEKDTSIVQEKDLEGFYVALDLM